MSDSIEIASAYVSLTTKMPGVKKDVEASLGEAETASDEAGARSGVKFGKALAVGVLAAAGVVTAAVKGLFDIGEGIDAAQDTLRVFTTETGGNLDGLNETVQNIAKETPAALGDIAGTVANLHQRLGLTGDDLQTVAEQYLNAGRLFGQEVDVQATTGLFNVFKIGAGDVSGAMDTLFNASRVAGVGMNDFSGTLSKAGPSAQLLGLTFDETAGFFASLSKAGVDVGRVAAGLGPALTNLAKDGEQPADAFKRVTGEIQTMAASGDIAGAQLEAANLFGAKGASQFVSALQDGTINMGDLGASISGVSDTILGVAGDTNDFAETWTVLQNNAQLALAPLASSVFDSLGDTLKGLMPTLTAFGGWLSDNLWVIGAAAAVIGGALTVAFIAWAASIWVTTVALLASPITWIILGVIALIAAIVLLVANWDTVVKFLSDTWAGFVGWFTGVMEGFAGWWNDLWAGFVGFVTDVWNGFVNWFMDVATGFSNWYIGLWMGLFSTVNDLWNGFVNWLNDGFNALVAGLQAIGAGLSSWWNGLWSGLASFVGDAFKNIGNFIIGVLNTVINLVNGALSGVNDMGRLASQVTGGAIGWSIGSLPTIPSLADGGFATARPGGMLAQIAEGRYDEVVLPLGGPQLEKVRDALGGSDGPTDLSDATIDKLARALAGYVRMQSRQGVAV